MAAAGPVPVACRSAYRTIKDREGRVLTMARLTRQRNLHSCNGTPMKRAAPIVAFAVLLAIAAPTHAEQSNETHETVPRTFGGAGDAFRSGGRELGSGFRGVGRGVKDTFTGQPASADYKDGRGIGTGFKDIGRGIAGSGRAFGRAVRHAFTDR